MFIKRRLYRWSISGFLALFLLTVAWGAAPEEPTVTMAKIGKKDLVGKAEMTIIKDDLTRERKVLIVGLAEGGKTAVERVEVSLDGGQTWRETTGREKWHYEFLPLPNYTYYLTLRVFNTDGVASDPKRFGITRLTYLPLTLSELIQQQADELARAYMSKDLQKYMGLISRDYQNIPRGWHRLRRAIENDFRSLNNIVLRFTVNQVYELQGAAMADIHWRLTYAGLLEPKEGYVEIHFDPADQLKIILQTKDLYFGAAPIGHDGSIVVQQGGFGFPGNHFVFILTDLDKVGARRINIQVRITASLANFTGNLMLTETPPRSGRFVESRYGCVVTGDRADATYIDEITSDWRRNVRRSGNYTF